MTHLHVTCGIIERDGLVLAARRGAGSSMALKWEFPGGKIREGESPEECLRRELREELSVRVGVGESLDPRVFDYPAFRITLYPFVCRIESGEVRPCEHAEVRWVSPAELRGLDWAAADVAVVESYLDKPTARE
jgi:8-oxo-dGTP diphosphatase